MSTSNFGGYLKRWSSVSSFQINSSVKQKLQDDLGALESELSRLIRTRNLLMRRIGFDEQQMMSEEEQDLLMMRTREERQTMMTEVEEEQEQRRMMMSREERLMMMDEVEEERRMMMDEEKEEDEERLLMMYREERRMMRAEFGERLMLIDEEERGRIMAEVEDKRRMMMEQEERRRMIKATEEVEDWLSRVQAVETEVGELIKQVYEAIDKLGPGFSLSKNHKSNKELRRKVAAKLEYMITVREEGDFIAEHGRNVTINQAGIRRRIEGMQLPIFDQVWRCFEEKDAGIVGLYGMGGVGKTTLLKQINMLLDHMGSDYSTVIWVKVYRDVQREKIQQQIWSKLGLFDETWESISPEEKASKIFNKLSQNKFVLLMDDIWERVDLNKVGVPFPDPETGSKIVFTTRSLKICRLMEADLQYKVECLGNEAAWEFFKSKVGREILDHRHPKYLERVKGVVDKCHGLPLALVSVVQTLAHSRSTQAALRWGQDYLLSDFLGETLESHVYHSLKTSYDDLQKDIFKTCLLYCCLFPSEYSISKRDLIDLWIGEGFLNVKIGAQKEGYYIINALLDACLLEEDGANFVKVHKMIHDMNLWIARGKGIFSRPNAGLTEDPSLTKWKHARRVSVMENKIEYIKYPPRCPDLQTLFLNRNCLKMIDSEFFRFMSSLKVLNLSGNESLIELPVEVSKLISLQYLDLSNTGIVELPKELMALVKLKCLNLECTFYLCTIPRQLISNISTLHVLRMLECGFFTGSAKEKVPSDGAEWLIEELLSLKNLNMLSVTLKNFQALKKFLSSQKLQSCTQSLWLRSLEHPKSIKVSLADLKHLQTLNISNCNKLDELKVDFEREVQSIRESSFYFLDEVKIESCTKLRDLTWLVLAPNLKCLTVSDCSDMEEIINVGRLGEFPEMMARNLIPLAKVTYLKLEKLPNLQSIYYSDLLLTEDKIDVIECPKLLKNLAILNKGKEPLGKDQATYKPSLDPCRSSSFS